MTDVGTIWTNFNKELKSFIYNKTRNSSDTDDILQEVFVKITRNIDKVNKSENLRQYLYGIVRNSVNDHYRSKKHFTSESEIPDVLTEEESGSLNSTIAECCIKPFINKLPQHYRDALLITEIENVSQKELAEKLKISYSGVKSRVQRGREKLKELIVNCCSIQSDSYGNIIDTEEKNCNCQ